MSIGGNGGCASPIALLFVALTQTGELIVLTIGSAGMD
jgi:hypothetical protein